jgi:hypothetical protein
MARSKSVGRMCWQAIAAGAIRTPTSSRTQPRQIDITASVTLIRNRRDTSTTLWASSNALPPPRRESCVKAPGGRRFQFRLAHACLPRRLGSPRFGRCPLLALSGQSGCFRVCPLLDNSGQSRISVRDGLSAIDPKRTSSIDSINIRFLSGPKSLSE